MVMHPRDLFVANPPEGVRPADVMDFAEGRTRSEECCAAKGAVRQPPREDDVTIVVLREVMCQYRSAPERFVDLPRGVNARNFLGLDLVELACVVHSAMRSISTSRNAEAYANSTASRGGESRKGELAQPFADCFASEPRTQANDAIPRMLLGELARQYLADPIAFRGPPPVCLEEGYAGIDLLRLTAAIRSLYSDPAG